MAGYRIISSDSHVVEPPDLWTARAKPEFRHRVPQLVRAHGGDWWYCDGIQGSPAATGSMAGVRFDQPEKLSMTDTFENVRPGAYIPEEHVKDMAIDGVDVGIIYPSAGLMLFSVPDTELVSAMFGTYNDWIAEFCGAFPDRLKGIGMVNVDDVGDSVKKLESCEKKGLAGAMITVYPPTEKSYDLPEYEPLWAAAEEMGMPLSLHSGTNRRRGAGEVFEGNDSVKPSWVCNLDYWVRMSLTNMIFSGVFERHPKLQVGSVEMELSWAPHFLDRMDTLYTQKTSDFAPYRFKEDMLPQRLLSPQRVSRLPGRCLWHNESPNHRGRQFGVGFGLSPSRVYLPKKPGNPGRHPGGLHQRGEGEDRRRKRRQDLQYRLGIKAPSSALPSTGLMPCVYQKSAGR